MSELEQVETLWLSNWVQCPLTRDSLTCKNRAIWSRENSVTSSRILRSIPNTTPPVLVAIPLTFGLNHHRPVNDVSVLGWQSPQHPIHRLVILTSMMIPCIFATYSCFLDYCAKSVSSLSRSLFLQVFLQLPWPFKKKKCLCLGTGWEYSDCRNVSDRCKSHDFRSLEMCT